MEINIDEIDNEELGRMIKSGIIKWQDIKEWTEKKSLKKQQIFLTFYLVYYSYFFFTCEQLKTFSARCYYLKF